MVSIFYLERRVRISLVPVLILHECSGPDEQDAGGSGQERGQAEGSPGPQTEETVRGPGEGDSQRFGSVFVFYGSGSSLKLKNTDPDPDPVEDPDFFFTVSEIFHNYLFLIY